MVCLSKSATGETLSASTMHHLQVPLPEAMVSVQKLTGHCTYHLLSPLTSRALAVWVV